MIIVKQILRNLKNGIKILVLVGQSVLELLIKAGKTLF